MPAKKNRENNNISNTLKLRHYIIDIIYHNNHESVKIPSIRQLATDFNLAKSTVQLIQEQLVQEGYLYSKKGIGTFTNPSMGFVTPHGTPPPLIGIIWGDGKLYFHDHYISRSLGAIASAITKDGWNCRHITFTSTSQDAIIDEITSVALDGLIWSHPAIKYTKTLEQLTAKIPTVVLSGNDEYKHLNRVSVDFESAGYELGKKLAEENRKTMLTATAGFGLNKSLNGLRKALLEVDGKETILNEIPAVFYKELEDYLTGNPPPDIMVINGRHTEFTMNMLKRHNIDPVNQCRVIALQHIISPENFTGYFLDEPFEQQGRIVADIMENLLHPQRNINIIQQSLPVEITRFNLP